jgi:hypothetical protein
LCRLLDNNEALDAAMSSAAETDRGDIGDSQARCDTLREESGACKFPRCPHGVVTFDHPESESEAIRMKTATLAQPSSSKSAGQQKTAVASAPGDAAPKTKAVSEEAVRLRAYQKWEAAGRPAGDGVMFWLEAERELSQAK